MCNFIQLFYSGYMLEAMKSPSGSCRLLALQKSIYKLGSLNFSGSGRAGCHMLITFFLTLYNLHYDFEETASGPYLLFLADVLLTTKIDVDVEWW